MAVVHTNPLARILAQQQRRLVVFAITISTCLLAISFTAYWQFALSLQSLSLSAVLSVSVGGMWLVFYSGFTHLNIAKVTVHLNVTDEDVEHSSQLLLKENEVLNRLADLQRRKVSGLLDIKLANNHKFYPSLPYRELILSAVLVVLLVVVVAVIWPSISSAAWSTRSPGLGTEPGISTVASQAPTQVSIEVNVIPPRYSGLAEVTSSDLNQEVLEGSDVTWLLSSNDKANDYVLEVGIDRFDFSSPPISPTPSSSERASQLQPVMHASWKAASTATYQISRVSEQGTEVVPVTDIHTIEVVRDKAPVIEFVTPQKMIIEFHSSAIPVFDLEATIKDDFSVESAEIMATIAKGSGESVKFRDQKVNFNQKTVNQKHWSILKKWDLRRYGMEEGDEMYFSITATDSKRPTANTTKSKTIVVRWLTEGEVGIAAEGMVIDVAVEYFKSQRQIIIETEDLVSKEAQYSAQDFLSISTGLGQAQADLKHKYGQYLGDELSGAPSDPMSEAHHEASMDDEHGHEEEHEHEHGNGTEGQTATIESIYERFGHNHGEADIGPITRRNPVALMKNAINQMWQAERHLGQGEPRQALPFEYEAYRFIKLAQQADRIYVKRLGFEPPPVSEERRYTGEFDDLSSTQKSQFLTKVTPDEVELINRALEELTYINSGSALNEGSRQTLVQLSDFLTTLSQTEAGVIAHVVYLQNVLRKNNDDHDAYSSLVSFLWHRLEMPIAQPRRNKEVLSITQNDGGQE